MEFGRRGFAAHTARRAECEAYVVGRDERAAACFGERNQFAVEALLAGIEMALQIEIEVAAAEDGVQTIAKGARILASHEHTRERTQRAAAEAYHSLTETFEVIEGYAALALGGIFGQAVGISTDGAQLRGGDHAAEIFVALAIRHEDVEPRRRRRVREPQAFVIECEFGANDPLEPRRYPGLIEARRPLQRAAHPESDRF